MLHLKSCLIIQEEDVVSCRQASREIAGLLGFDTVEQTRIATAVSELARNAYEYAKAKDAQVEFSLDDRAIPQMFVIRIRDSGAGIANLKDILEGRYRSSTGMGVGISGAKRLMDRFEIESAPGGTQVLLGKTLPKRKMRLDAAQIEVVIASLKRPFPPNPLSELRQQNQELLRTLQELEKRQSELALLNQELAETNRGVVALYAELDERAERLKQADEVKTRFLSHMSHEFRMPLISVLRLSGFLLDRADGPLNEEQEKQVRLIQKSTQELSEMVNDLLDLAKVQSGTVTVRPEDFSVADLFGSLRGIFRPLQHNKQVSLVFQAPAAMPRLHTDEGKIAQILRNFISNALKFTLEGTVEVTASYDARVGEIFFTVRDTGVGIPPQYRDTVFEEFSQIENSLQKQVKGTGLGLALSRKLARLLKGEIGLEQTEEPGSTFFLRVPLHYRDDTQAQNGAMPAFSPVALLIGADESSCGALRQALAAKFYTIYEAGGCEEGLRMLREKSPKVIFLNLADPDSDGLKRADCLGELARQGNIPVILHAARPLSAREEKTLKPLAFDVISKPIAYEALLAYIERIGARLLQKDIA